MFLSVSAGPGRANGAIRRFLVGLPPGTSGGKHPGGGYREMPGPFGLKIMGPNGPGDCLSR